MSEKELKELLKDIRTLLQTHTTAVSQVIELSQQVSKNYEQQQGVNNLLTERLETLGEKIKELKKDDEKKEEEQKSFQRMVMEKVTRNSVISTLVQAIITAVTIAIVLQPWQ